MFKLLIKHVSLTLFCCNNNNHFYFISMVDSMKQTVNIADDKDALKNYRIAIASEDSLD